VPTVAPIRPLTNEERSATDWYTRLVDWWGFDPLDIAPMMGMSRGAKKLVGRKGRVGPLVQKEGSGEAYKPMKSSRTGPISPTEVTPFELTQLGLNKGIKDTVPGGSKRLAETKRTTKPATKGRKK